MQIDVRAYETYLADSIDRVAPGPRVHLDRTRIMKALGGFIGALGLIALLVLVAVAMYELQHASSHPFRYGPAKVMASAAGGAHCCLRRRALRSCADPSQRVHHAPGTDGR
jgi:hypothetical protein